MSIGNSSSKLLNWYPMLQASIVLLRVCLRRKRLFHRRSDHFAGGFEPGFLGNSFKPTFRLFAEASTTVVSGCPAGTRRDWLERI